MKGPPPIIRPAIKPAGTKATGRVERGLSEAELREFRAHASANLWDSKSGIAPSAHIKSTFAKWLGRGLGRVHIVSAQPNLANAYTVEVSRHPSKRVNGLLVRPHKLPPGAPRPFSARLVAELSDEEKAARRAYEREKKRRSRAADRDADGPPVGPRKLPPGAPRPLSVRLVAERSDEEKEAKRAYEREKKTRSRQKLSALTRS